LSLKNIIAIVGENELSPADRSDYQSAKKLIEFFSQNFNVAEHLTGKKGEYYTREQTLDGIEAILSGKQSMASQASKTPGPTAPAQSPVQPAPQATSEVQPKAGQNK
jgi:F-type H+-transporting ATPase subunit beta